MTWKRMLACITGSAASVIILAKELQATMMEKGIVKGGQ